LDFFFFFISFFLFLVSWLLDVVLSPGKARDEDEETEEEDIGSTLKSSCRDSDEGDGGTRVMTLGTNKIKNNQMGN